MKLRLISHPLCPFVHRSAILLIEKSVPYELSYIDLRAKPDWFLKLSPRGKIPLLTVDEKPLFESSAINEFLDETHPPRLLPEDPYERARQRAWIEVANDLFAAHFKLITAAKADLEAATTALDGALGRFESELREPFFAGDRLGLVDIAVAPAFHRFAAAEAHGAPSSLARFPKVAAWAQRLATRPSTVRAVPDDFVERYLGMLRELGGSFVRDVMKLG